MNTIVIETAANGFIVRERSPIKMVQSEPYVFESFESLTAWLRDKLLTAWPKEQLVKSDR